MPCERQAGNELRLCQHIGACEEGGKYALKASPNLGCIKPAPQLAGISSSSPTVAYPVCQ